MLVLVLVSGVGFGVGVGFGAEKHTNQASGVAARPCTESDRTCSQHRRITIPRLRKIGIREDE